MVKNSKAGEIIIPVAAVRDEGVSYHYLEPSREVECNKEAVQIVTSSLEQMEVPFTTGKTWTTDAFYRETPDMIELRRNEGCITVEMEAAAFFAVSQYIIFRLSSCCILGMMSAGRNGIPETGICRRRYGAALFPMRLNLLRDWEREKQNCYKIVLLDSPAVLRTLFAIPI